MSHSIEIKDVLGTYEVAVASSEKPRKKLVITTVVRGDDTISFFTVYSDNKKRMSSVDTVTAVAAYNSI